MTLPHSSAIMSQKSKWMELKENLVRAAVIFKEFNYKFPYHKVMTPEFDCSLKHVESALEQNDKQSVPNYFKIVTLADLLAILTTCSARQQLQYK